MSAVQNNLVPAQPHIQYHPDFEKYQDRTRRRQETETLQDTVPVGFPRKLNSPLVWEGKDIEKLDDWIYHLSDVQLDEIDKGLQSFKSAFRAISPWVTSATLHSLFLLFTRSFEISPRRSRPAEALSFFGGLRIDDYSREDNIMIYAGVSSHSGNIRGPQQDTRLENGTSPIISHIKDLTGIVDEDKIGAPSNTADKQVFHTDAGDIVSLLCLGPAAEAGESYLSSSGHVYNILAKERPDLIHTLSQDWPVDGFNNPQKPYTLRPLLYHQAATATTPERVLIQYARRYFTGFQAQPRSKDIPPITEALDALHILAEKHRAALDFQ
ncbi:uncharacterized protein N7477_002347 [Penicillium maclennaniae]|uniref:uncharacterized protein n=1 Tax=Penicillium maclennaniae TaxID=1343394 RepID=UPI0025400507|nr:uncharacterized protein N7477_002347 [Penicillium maclennaniae]KAJ5676714.1 hypothetical protein N7477_002347 [Penicillium maclennaniae]